MSNNTTDDMPSRVGRLEASVTNLHSELGDVKLAQRLQSEAQAAGFREIQLALTTREREHNAALTQRDRTNWPVIFGLIGLAGTLYVAGISPLKQDVERERREREILANAVIVKEEKIFNLKTEMVDLKAQVRVNTDIINNITTKGSPVMDKRIALIEQRMGVDIK